MTESVQIGLRSAKANRQDRGAAERVMGLKQSLSTGSSVEVAALFQT